MLTMKYWIALAASLLIVGSASAQPADGGGGGGGGGGRGAMRRACADDIAKLCPGVQPGGGRIGQCMREHRDALSDTCKSAMMNARAERREHGGKAQPGAPPPQPQD
jgi:hypothetical protein